MLNMLDTQDHLKNFSEEQLVQEMQMPSGSVPQFMVLGEIDRRKRMRAEVQKQQGLMQPTVAQEAVTAAGVPQQGIAQVAQSLAPKTDITQNTGAMNVQAAGLPGQPNQPQRMAGGGVLKLAPGGPLSAIESLRQNYPNIYDLFKDDPASLRAAARGMRDTYETPEQTGLESVEATPSIFQRYLMGAGLPVSNRRRAQQRRVDLGGLTPEEYALDQRAQSLATLRTYDANDPIFAEGSPVEFVPGTTGPTPVSSVEGMFEAPTLSATEDTTRPYFPLTPEFDNLNLPSSTTSPRMALAGLTDSSDFGGVPLSAPSVDASADVSGLQDEQARRLYLSGRDYEESDAPAIVRMLNRAREFQEGDTYTPPEQIYDLSPRGRLKYEMADASPIEQARAFRDTSDRLSQEAQQDEGVKVEAFLDAENVRSDAQRLADAAIDSRMNADARSSSRGLVNAALEIPEEGIGALLPPGVTPLDTPPADTSSGGASGGGASGGGASGGGASGGGASGGDTPAPTSSMDQDKWLALAQAGFTLMSTGDFGKAGQAGLAAYSQYKKAAQDARKLEAELALIGARTAASNRSGRGGSSGLNLNQALSRGKELMDTGHDALELAGDNADAAAEARAIIAIGRQLIQRATGVSPAASPSLGSAGPITLPSAR